MLLPIALPKEKYPVIPMSIYKNAEILTLLTTTAVVLEGALLAISFRIENI